MPSDDLRYPFDFALLARRRKRLRSDLASGGPFTDVKVAILGGSTTADFQDFLELFLLDAGIRPSFHVSEFDRWWEEAVVDDTALRAFGPDVVLVHTTHRNIREWPRLLATEEEVEKAFAAEYGRFETMWTRVLDGTECLLVQNNFDPPALEPLGNLGASAHFGCSHFVQRLNMAFASYARRTPRMRINDIQTLAYRVGQEKWTSARHWLHYRMALTPEGSALAAHAAARTIRAAFGKSKKCLVLDLDDTLWGGIVGEDGVDGLRLGHETPEGEAFVAFQRYCLALKERGVLLAVCSKNDPDVARSGFGHRDSVLRVEDFSAFVANWEPKSENLRAIARQLSIGLDSLVFVDDNPAEQELVRRELPEVSVLKAREISAFAETLDREGYFEPFTLTAEDLPRARQYAEGAARAALEQSYVDYGAYLESLEMHADIGPFAPANLERVTQLVNKTNQFNLTTRRYTLARIESIARDAEYVTLAGRLRDRFGDSGLVSAVIARRDGANRDELHVELWVMSCRVLKRELELAMFDALVVEARRFGVRTLVGHYAPTPKNGMVANHYQALGFEPYPGADVNTWRLDLDQVTAPRCRRIRSTP